MLIHRNCTGRHGRAVPRRMAIRMSKPSPPLVGMVQAMNLVRLSKTFRPSSTAASIEAKLSSVRIMSAAPLETSVPVMPMATPMSACLSAGASFTPSPVMATMCPRLCSARTSRSFCSGATRANTAVRSAVSASWSSGICSSSWPVMARSCSSLPWPPRRPSCPAMATAVPLWSPVIIFTSMPAFWQSATARMASARGGSIMPCNPSKVKPPATSSRVSRSCPAGTRRRANASTRNPCAVISLTTAWIEAGSSGISCPAASSILSQRSTSRSTEPFL